MTACFLSQKKESEVPIPVGQHKCCPIPLSCGMVLDIDGIFSFLNWKHRYVRAHHEKSGRGWTLSISLLIVEVVLPFS